MTAPIDPAMAHCAGCAHRLGSGCGCTCCGWAGEAVAALREVIARVYSSSLPGLADHTAREAFAVALPVIAAAVTAGERERCAALAEQHKARYDVRKSCSCGRTDPRTGEACSYVTEHDRPFADLLRAPGAAAVTAHEEDTTHG